MNLTTFSFLGIISDLKQWCLSICFFFVLSWACAEEGKWSCLQKCIGVEVSKENKGREANKEQVTVGGEGV